MGRGEGRWGRGKAGARRETGVEAGGGRGGKGRGAGADARQLPGSVRRAPPPQGGSRRLLALYGPRTRPSREPRPDRNPPSLASRSPTPTPPGARDREFPPLRSRDSAIPSLSNPDRPRFWYSRFKGPGNPESTVLRFLNVLVLGLPKTKSEIPQC